MHYRHGKNYNIHAMVSYKNKRLSLFLTKYYAMKIYVGWEGCTE
jgi:hypothetical protein